MEEKTIHCPICNTSTSARAFLQTYISPYNKQEYKMYECLNCQVQWWEPLKMIPEFYENEIFESYIDFHEAMGEKLGENHKAFFKYFPKEIKGRLLDVGCGDGRFIFHARNFGFEVWGIDFDKKSVANIKKILAIETVFPMSLEEFYEYAKKKNLKFDVITFFEVLEHQEKPAKFLEIISLLLKGGGYIAGSVPNRESFFQKELNQKIHKWIDHPPHHFLSFSKSALEKALEKNGFREIEIFKLDFPFEGLFPYLEVKILGKNFENLKIKLKTTITKNKMKAKEYSIEELEKAGKDRIKAKLFKVLKLIKNLILFPFILPYVGSLKGNGINLYFQAKK
jgi:2-polyprenyl-3-methyl-5-hydroxy-6-metoxy-1,4-benzoquinol methylase